MDKKEALKTITDTLYRFQIPFALIGAYAVSAWGIPRATKDMDFIITASPDKIKDLDKALRASGLVTEITIGSPDDPVNGMIKVKFSCKGRGETIDLLLGVKGITKDIYARTVDLTVLGIKIPVLSAQDLVATKLIAGGPLDIDDARNVLKTMAGRIDMEYLKDFCLKNKLNLPEI